MPATHADLRSIPLFAGLSFSDLERVVPLVQEQSFHAKKVVFHEGSPFSGLHIVKSGRVKTSKGFQNREQILEILGEGELLDPIPLFDQGAHCATAKTLDDTLIYRLEPDAARQLMGDYSFVLTNLLTVMSKRLRKLATLANDLAFKDVTARVCKVLLDQALLEGEAMPRGIRLKQTLTRQDLAALVGTAREVAWRALKRLERDGLIQILGRQILIVDVERLKAMT